jgi:hypothetical protein
MARKTRKRSGTAAPLDQVTHLLDRGGRQNDAITGQVAAFMAGFLSGADEGGKGSRRRRRWRR